ncbi:hypothetical protein ABZ611_33730 [Streptomyces sp. NPDC007861]|uniref:hypothetical protein n=1 Tax=Streptomyces sp. NPDC007861 TaxID=3154893 RepID=UPI0033F31077
MPIKAWLNSTKSGKFTKGFINTVSAMLLGWRMLLLSCGGVLVGFSSIVNPLLSLGVFERLLMLGLGIASLALAIASYTYMKNSNKWNW